MDYDGYLDKMFNIETCGFKTTLIIVSIMLGIDICVLRPDFIWLSEDVPPYKCPVVLVQDINGRFYGTKVSNPVYIGLVPKINCPMKLDDDSDMVDHSTPRQQLPRSKKIASMKFGGVSPIPEERKSSVNKEVVHTQNMNAETSTYSDICAESTSKNSDHTDETTSTSSSIAAIQQAVHNFEEANIPQTTSLSTTIDPNEQDCGSNIIQHGQQDDIMSSPIGNASSIMYSEGTPSKLPDTDTPASLEISSSVKNSRLVGEVAENSSAHSYAEVSIDQYVESETVSMSHIAASDDNVQETNNSDHITEQPSHDETIQPECEIVMTDKENEHPDKQDEDEKKPTKRRLGISGLASSKKKLNVSLTNISDELHLKEYNDTIQICGTAKKDKILKYACQKCPEMFFTVEGYHKHLSNCTKYRTSKLILL